MATISRLSVDLVANSAQFRKDLEKASKSADKSFGKMMKSAKAATAAFVGIGTAAGAIFIKSAKTYGDFSEALQDVSAKTGATKNQLDQLSVSMRNAAKATRFTATQTAEAGTFLAQAGFNVKEINDALRPTLDLAAATKTSVQNTADFMTNILKGMGMTTDEVARASDVLAVTTAKSNTNLTDLATAMSEAAPSARAFGMSIEETSALLGSMANAGIKGSRAGISLRASFAALSTTGSLTENMLANATGQMTTQTKALRKLGVHTKTAEGDMRNLVTILHELKDAGGNEQDMIAIFGRRAGSALMQFMNEGLEGADQLQVKLEGARGAAERMAATQMDSLNGDLLLFNSQLEELQMIVAENGINDLFRSITQSATKFMKNAEPALATMAKFADEIAIGLGIITGAIILGGIAALTSAMFGLAAAMLANPITWIVGGITLIGIGIFKAIQNIEQIKVAFRNWVGETSNSLKNIGGMFKMTFLDIRDGVLAVFTKMEIGFAKFKVGFIGIFNDILTESLKKVNNLLEIYNKIPFLDDATPITFQLDTTQATDKVTALEAKLAEIQARNNSFTASIFTPEVFTPPVVDGGAGIEDVMSPADKALTEQEQLKADLQRKADIEMEHMKKLFNMKADFATATTALANGSWEDVIDAGAKGSKKLQMIQKASAMKQIIMSTATGIAEALKLPFPASLLAGAKTAAAGAIQLQKVKGQFHDGIDDVPNTGTYLLEQGERVVDKRLNRDMTDFLANQNQGGNTTNNNPTLNFNVSGSDAEGIEKMLMNHRGKFEGMIRDIYNESAQNSPF